MWSKESLIRSQQNTTVKFLGAQLHRHVSAVEGPDSRHTFYLIL